MKTYVTETDIRRAAAILRSGGLVGVPTETVYGLAANGLDASAVGRIYEVKGRPDAKALSLLVHGADALSALCADIPAAAFALACAFWPGPLTMILRNAGAVPAIVTAGGETVGVRCPDHALTLALIQAAGVPLAAPSANPSGKASPKTAGEVLAYFDGKIEAVLDGGPCKVGVESTILDLTVSPPRILRQGGLSAGAIEAVLQTGVSG
jgi:L-threonylcarbamoyladenylate synthase